MNLKAPILRLKNPFYKKTIFCFAFTFLMATVPALPTSAQENNPIRVITGGHDAHIAIRNKQNVSGPNTTLVAQFLNKNDIPHTITPMVWTRAFNMIQSTEDVLIYPLTRTMAREDKFQWILEIDQYEYDLVGLTSLLNKNLTKEQIINDGYFGACVAGTSSCDALINYGFDKKYIIYINGETPEDLVNFFLKGRASFIIENYEQLIQPILEKNPDLKGKLQKFEDAVFILGDYLAAKKISPALQKALQ